MIAFPVGPALDNGTYVPLALYLRLLDGMRGAKCAEYDASDRENKQNDDQSTAVHRLPQAIIQREADQSYSALILAALITLPHFSVSSAMSLPKSAGEPPSGTPPNSSRRVRSLDRPALR